MIKFYLILVSLCIINSYWANAQMSNNEPHVVTVYLDAQGKKLPSAIGAFKRSEITYNDSVSGVSRQYYASGIPASFTEYENVRRHIMNGINEKWFDNGQLHLREHWAHGKRTGELVTYYKNGTLKRREIFDNDQSIGGQCFDSAGKLIEFYAYETMPIPPGGMKGFMKYVNSNLHYPKAAFRENIQGKVFINFSVDTTGQLRNIKVEKGLHPLIDAEALRVVESAPPWVPASQDGLNTIIVNFTMPINFSTRRPAKSK